MSGNFIRRENDGIPKAHQPSQDAYLYQRVVKLASFAEKIENKEASIFILLKTGLCT
jgi:hypothetical protein